MADIIIDIIYDDSNLKFCDDSSTSNGNGYSGPTQVTIIDGETNVDFDVNIYEVKGYLITSINIDNKVTTNILDCCLSECPPGTVWNPVTETCDVKPPGGGGGGGGGGDTPPLPIPIPSTDFDCCDYVPKDYIRWADGWNMKQLIPPNQR